MRLNQIALECVDALSSSPLIESWEHLIEAAEDVLRADEVPTATAETLQEAVGVLRAEKGNGKWGRALQGGGENARQTAERLRSAAFGERSPYLYHGTVFGRLERIAREGLRTGAEPVWKSDESLKAHLDGAVFFMDTWRGAIRWAHSAHIFSKGPRAGKARYPVILRVHADQYEVEPDLRANAWGSLMVQSNIPADAIELLVEIGKPLPRWEPLGDAFERLRRAKRLEQAGLADLRPEGF